MGNTQKTKEKILKTFEENTENHWKTISEIQGATGSTTNEIVKVITDSGEFVQSSKIIDGETVFTTKKAFRDNEPFFTKVLGAFKNRID